MHPLKILMVGTSQQTRGGIATVERLMVEGTRALSYRHLVTHSDSRLGKHWRFLVACLRCLVAVRTEYQLAHIHFAVRGSLYRKYVLSRILRWKGIPYVLHSHAPTSVMEGQSPRWQARARRMLSESSGLIALSRTWADFYRHLADRRLKVWTLPNPVRLPAGTRKEQRGGPVALLFLGRIGERKGAFELLEAMATLHRLAPGQAHLTMAGDGEVERAQAFARDAGIGDCVAIRGWADEKTKEALLARSDVLVLPSRAEGLPMALLEAMAHELAVVASRVGGIPDLVADGENGLLVPPGDAAALSRALLRLVNDAALRRRLAASAKSSVASLSLPHYLHSLEGIYAQALKREFNPE